MSVQVVKCPEISFHKKAQPSHSSHNSSFKSNKNVSKSGNMGKEEIREFMGSVKSFAVTNAIGLEKQHHKQDILTKLGVPPPKEQKMPFK